MGNKSLLMAVARSLHLVCVRIDQQGVATTEDLFSALRDLNEIWEQLRTTGMLKTHEEFVNLVVGSQYPIDVISNNLITEIEHGLWVGALLDLNLLDIRFHRMLGLSIPTRASKF